MTWLSNNWGKLILFALVSFVVLRVLDLLSLKWLFSYFASTFSSIGITNEYLVKALGVALMTITALLAGELFSKVILKRTKEGTAVAGLALVAWLLFLFILSQPKDGEYINPVTGEHLFVYVILPDGEIDLKPIGYKFHPETGQEMQPLTPQKIVEFREQIKRFEEKHRKSSARIGLGEAFSTQKHTVQPQAPPINRIEYPKYIHSPEWGNHYGRGFFDREPYEACGIMRVESVHLHQDKLCLKMLFRNNCDSKDSFSIQEPEPKDTYVVTDYGEALKVSGHTDLHSFPDICYELVPGETVEAYFTFPAPSKPVKRLSVTYKSFSGISIVILG